MTAPADLHVTNATDARSTPHDGKATTDKIRSMSAGASLLGPLTSWTGNPRRADIGRLQLHQAACLEPFDQGEGVEALGCQSGSRKAGRP
mgnify:FL=1